MILKKIIPGCLAILAFLTSAFVTEAYIDRALAENATNVDFKVITKEKYNELQNLLKQTSNKESLGKFFQNTFNTKYIASNACRENLSEDKAKILLAPLTNFAVFLFNGEAIQKVTTSTINSSKMTTTTKKNLTFVNSELSDETKFTTVFLTLNQKLIDLRCMGVSIIGTLDAIIEKYCTKKGLSSFRTKKIDGRIDIVKDAIAWHISGQP